MHRSVLAIVSIAAATGCGTEPSGILTVTVNAQPEFTTVTAVTLAGSVSRTPASETPIVVAIAGGAETVSDTVTGTFSFPVTLNANRENQLAVTASDGTGSISDPVIVVIVHDDTGPQVGSSIPRDEGTNVPLNTPIEVRFAEPLVQSSPDASFTLTQNSRAVQGTATLSGDQTLFTFQPTQALEPHSIYEMVITGFTDDAGNPAGDGSNTCFITTSEGLDPHVTADTSSLGYGGAATANRLTAMDLVGGSLARSGSTLYGLFEFAQARTLRGDTDKASIFVDIDLDEDPTTGFKGIKDEVFDTNFPELNTGMGAEAVIALDAHGVAADSAFVGVSVDDASWDEIDLFLPGVCGRFFGFHTTAILGDSIRDNGRFSYTYTAIAVEDPVAEETAFFLDPVPVGGHFQANLSDPGPASLRRLQALRSRTQPRRRESVLLSLFRLLRLR